MSGSKIQGYVLDAFLEWMVDECDTRGESYTICTERDRFGRFELVWVQTSWVAWQASRVALVIELPERQFFASGAELMDASKVILAIQDAGVKAAA